MKKMKLIPFLILFIVIIGFFIFPKINVFAVKTNKTSQMSLIQDRLVELSELTTLKYEYKNVIISRTNRSIPLLGDNEVQFGEAIKLIEYNGYLKAGTDLSKLEISYDEPSKIIRVRVPKSRILDNVAETENMKIEDVKGSILSDYPTQTVLDDINFHKNKLEEEKISQGFLDEADNRVRLLLISYLKSAEYSDVIVVSY